MFPAQANPGVPGYVEAKQKRTARGHSDGQVVIHDSSFLFEAGHMCSVVLLDAEVCYDSVFRFGYGLPED